MAVYDEYISEHQEGGLSLPAADLFYVNLCVWIEDIHIKLEAFCVLVL